MTSIDTARRRTSPDLGRSDAWWGPLDGPRPSAATLSGSCGDLGASSGEASVLAAAGLPPPLPGPASVSSTLAVTEYGDRASLAVTEHGTRASLVATIEYGGRASSATTEHGGRASPTATESGGRTSLPALGASAELLARPSLRAALQDPVTESASEAAQLRSQMAAVRAEIEKRDAALALLPGNKLLEDELHDQSAKRMLQGQATKASRKSSILLQQEGVLEDDGFIMVKGKDTFSGENALILLVKDLDACKQLCLDGPPGGQPFGAMVVRQGKAYFRQQSASQCRENMVDDPGATTYLKSSPQAAALCADIRRAVVRRHELQLEMQEHQKQRENGAGAGQATGSPAAAPAAFPYSSSRTSSPCAAAAGSSAAAPTASLAWQDNAVALEAELRRKSALSMELHRRVHQLEADLELQLQYNDQRIDEVKATLERAAHGYCKQALMPERSH